MSDKNSKKILNHFTKTTPLSLARDFFQNFNFYKFAFFAINFITHTVAVFMPKERDTRKPKGFTFCQYKRKEDATDAIKGMNGRVSMKSLHCEPCQFVYNAILWLLCCVFKCIVHCVKISVYNKKEESTVLEKVGCLLPLVHV